MRPSPQTSPDHAPCLALKTVQFGVHRSVILGQWTAIFSSTTTLPHTHTSSFSHCGGWNYPHRPTGRNSAECPKNWQHIALFFPRTPLQRRYAAQLFLHWLGGLLLHALHGLGLHAGLHAFRFFPHRCGVVGGRRFSLASLRRKTYAHKDASVISDMSRQ